MIELRTDRLLVRVDEDRGADIVHVGRDEQHNVLFHGDWLSPLRASRSTTWGDPVLDWLSEYRGDWQELFPNGGDACEVMGVPVPFHGEVSTARWEVVEQAADRVVMRTGTRLPLVLERTMAIDAQHAALRIEERAINESDLRVPFIWGHHPAFAVTESSVLDIPAHRIEAATAFPDEDGDLEPGASGAWPTLPGRDGRPIDLRQPILPRRAHRLVWLQDLPGWAAIRDPRSGSGVALAWDATTFAHAWLWQEVLTPGMPWFGRSRITAIEPQMSWPSQGLAAAIERGQARWLEPGGSHATWITCAVFQATERAVDGVTRAGEVREVQA
ncbi:MAG: aldose 1-epimerase [Chloroflexi bacterium]|nr:aldose 1-epimerase [Chloroflexota bacterium]